MFDLKETLLLKAGEGESYEVRDEMSQFDDFINLKITMFGNFKHLKVLTILFYSVPSCNWKKAWPESILFPIRLIFWLPLAPAFCRLLCQHFTANIFKRDSYVLEVLSFQHGWSLLQPGWGGQDQAFQGKADSLHLQHVSENIYST